ncbi:MAG: DUF4135 domain-containing protein, partial [Cyanobacteria bacterium P01_A01_bin.17]
LDAIATTGSDYHKGGKQVLILTFTLANNTTQKLVYKPSDVEIDLRLVGDTAAVRNHLEPGLQITHSFSELINSAVDPNRAELHLPTYKILPRRSGSLLQANANGVLPIQESYGYVEFLTHLPYIDNNDFSEAGLLQGVRQQPQNALQNADWITQDDNEARNYWRILGKLLAMLTLCGCTDIHIQNFIVHARKPYVIDLEEAFKKRHITYEDTYLDNRALSTLRDPGSKEPSVDGDKTLRVKLRYKFLNEEHSFNQLVLLQAQNPTLTKREHYIQDLARGFIQTIHAFRNQAFNQQMVGWLTEAQDTVVRYVPIATVDLANQVRGLFKPEYLVNDAVPNNVQAYLNFTGWYLYDRPKHRDDTRILMKLFMSQINFYNAKVRASDNDADKAWLATPRFAIYHPDHNYHDFFNLDVPSYYHRLSSPHLLNSRGMRVVPRDVWAWWDQNAFARGIKAYPDDEEPVLEPATGRRAADGSYVPASSFDTFFPDSPLTLFQQIFREFRDLVNVREFVINNLSKLGKGRTQEIIIDADGISYVLPEDAQKPATYRMIPTALALSDRAEPNQTADKEPVSINGMNVLFHQVAPATPVCLQPKVKS